MYLTWGRGITGPFGLSMFDTAARKRISLI